MLSENIIGLSVGVSTGSNDPRSGGPLEARGASIIFGEDKSIVKKRSRKHKQERYQINFWFTLEKYEYLARLSRSSMHNSIQRTVDDLLFSRPWVAELQVLRNDQRKLRVPDTDFYPLSVKVKMGVKGKRGRRPCVVARKAA